MNFDYFHIFLSSLRLGYLYVNILAFNCTGPVPERVM